LLRLLAVAPSADHPVRGSCLCGAVSYEITRPFERAGYCHCSRCRKLTGGLAGLNGRVPAGGLRLLSSGDALGSYTPAEGGSPVVFCRTCGSTLGRGQWPDGPVIGVRLGTLDDDPGIRPQYHIFVDSRAPWEELPDDGLPRYPERRP
jgi:hypothetical protein